MALIRNQGIIIFFWILIDSLLGQSYLAKRHAVSDELLSTQPQKVYYGPGHRIYLASKNGIFLYDGHYLHQVDFRDSKMAEVTILKDNGKYLFAGFADGTVWKIDGKRTEQIEFNDINVQTPINDIAFLGGTIIIGTYGQGIICKNEQKIIVYGENEGLSSNDVYSIEYISDNQILVSSDKGQEILSIKPGDLIHKSFLLNDFPRDIITDILYDSLNHQVFYSTMESGVFSEIGRSNRAQKISASGNKIGLSYDGKLIIQNKISKSLISVDPCNHSNLNIDLIGLQKPLQVIDFSIKQDLLWVLCKNNGLLSVRLNLEVYKTGISEIQSILRKRDILYIGTEKGLYSFNLKNKFSKKLANQNILSLIWDDAREELYAGTFGEGIIQLDKTGKLIRKIGEKDGIANNSILSMFLEENTLIISSLGGVTLWDINKQNVSFNNWTKVPGLAYVYKTLKDKKGNYWIGTDRKGLYSVDQRQKIAHVIKNKTIFNLLLDNSGRVWVHQENGSIGFIDKTKIKYIYQSESGGLHDISNINVSSRGTVIMFSQVGMYQFDPPNYIKSGIDHLTDMINLDLNLNANFMDNEGRVWFGREDFIYSYNHLPIDGQKPQIEILGASLGKRNFLGVDSVFNASDNDLFVNFTGLWPFDHEQIKFKYKLNGLHNTWIETKDQNVVISNLSPGKYTFELVCFRRNAPTLLTVYRKSFLIQLPLWKTWWFIFLSLCIFIGILFLIFSTIQKRRNKINELKSLQIKSELELVKSQINPHFLFNSFNTLLSVVETNPDEAPQYINRLSDYFRKILQYREIELITMSEELKLLENYIYLLKTRYGNQIKVEYESIQSSDCKIIPMTLQLLIENAVKHNIISQKHHLLINLVIKHNFLEVCNQVNRKIISEPSTHYGLQSLSKRYLLMCNRKIEIIDDGEKFCVRIPLL